MDKKLDNFPFLKLILKVLNKLIQTLGSIFLLIIILLVFHYYSSGMYVKYKPVTLFKKIDKIIFDRYFGFSFFEIDKYSYYKFKSLKYIFSKNELEEVFLNINQENLYNLELQRKSKLKGKTQKFDRFSRASLNYNQIDYNIKIRVKGDRALHWYKSNQTSYKIDLRGEDRIWGLEEFSIQKPITRNYIYEYIFHKYLALNELISLKYFFINLSLNGTNQGIYAIEEGFSKELLERNKKRNGPIFGVEEKVSLNYPKIDYDLYSKAYWLLNHPQLIKDANIKLDEIKNEKKDIEKIFDLEKWATYFAIIDLTGNFHGSIPKSVKLYFNPITTKFEPIGFDGHYNSNLFQNFLILDFLDDENRNCSYICPERNWYLRFLKNENFKKLYFEKLREISSLKLVKNFHQKNLDMINFYNNQFLSENSKKDRVFYKGLGLYIFDENYLYNRSDYIQGRINEIENKLIDTKVLNEDNFDKRYLLSKK